MRRFSLIVFPAFFVLLFSGCDHNPLNSQFPADYMPLLVGGEWIYSGVPLDSTFRDTATVIGTATLGGHKYFILNHTNDPIPTGDQRQFLRISGNKIYINHKGREFIYVDFNQPEGGTWKSYDDFTGMMLKKDFEITTPAGHFTHAVEVAFLLSTLKDAASPLVTFVPNVGIVRYRGYFVRPAKLAEYNIDHTFRN